MKPANTSHGTCNEREEAPLSAPLLASSSYLLSEGVYGRLAFPERRSLALLLLVAPPVDRLVPRPGSLLLIVFLAAVCLIFLFLISIELLSLAARRSDTGTALEACADGNVDLGRDSEAESLGYLGKVQSVDVKDALERVRAVRLQVAAVAVAR